LYRCSAVFLLMLAVTCGITALYWMRRGRAASGGGFFFFSAPDGSEEDHNRPMMVGAVQVESSVCLCEITKLAKKARNETRKFHVDPWQPDFKPWKPI
jgi:hypothetical protein